WLSEPLLVNLGESTWIAPRRHPAATTEQGCHETFPQPNRGSVGPAQPLQLGTGAGGRGVVRQRVEQLRAPVERPRQRLVTAPPVDGAVVARPQHLGHREVAPPLGTGVA